MADKGGSPAVKKTKPLVVADAKDERFKPGIRAVVPTNNSNNKVNEDERPLMEAVRQKDAAFEAAQDLLLKERKSKEDALRQMQEWQEKAAKMSNLTKSIQRNCKIQMNILRGSLQQQLDDKDQTIELLKNMVTEMEEKGADVVKAMDTNTGADNSVLLLIQRLEELQSNKREIAEQLAQLEGSRDVAKDDALDELDSLRTQYEDLKRRYFDATCAAVPIPPVAAAANLGSIPSAVAAEMEQMKREKAQLEDLVANAQRTMEHEIAGKLNELKELEAKNKKAWLEMHARFEHERLEHEAHLEQERKAYESKYQALERAHSLSVGSDRNPAQSTTVVEATVARLESEISALHASTAELKRSLRQAEDKAKTSSQEVESLTLQLCTSKLALQTAEQRALESGPAAVKETAEAVQLIAKSEQDLLQAKIKDLRDQLEAANAKTYSTQAEVDRLNDALSHTESKLMDMAALISMERDELNARIQAGERERASLLSQNEAGDKERTALGVRMASLERERIDLIARIAACESESLDLSSKLTADKQAFEEKIDTLRADAAREVKEAEEKGAHLWKSRFEQLAATLHHFKQRWCQTLPYFTQLRQEVDAFKNSMLAILMETSFIVGTAVEEMDCTNKLLAQKYRKEMAQRKRYHNELVEIKGNIRVFCRVRPRIENDGDTPFVVSVDDVDDTVLYVNSKGTKKTIELDQVFGPNASQDQVFKEVQDLAVSCVDGYNVCIFAYGQTGSGKTFTMEGTPEFPGINRRTLNTLFDVAAERAADFEYTFSISMVEIYNEQVRDLLQKSSDKLEIKQGPEGNYVPGLAIEQVSVPEDVQAVFKTGNSNRVTASTSMNDQSSRSHSVLTVYVRGVNKANGQTTTGRLNLVDLAGSERVGKSDVDGDRLKEAQSINKSLSSLGDVIHALINKKPHIPYRNSKLTYLLQDSLGGDSKTLMIVQCSPTEYNVGETVCSLNFASRVRNVELGMATKKSETAEVAGLKARVAELEDKVARLAKPKSEMS